MSEIISAARLDFRRQVVRKTYFESQFRTWGIIALNLRAMFVMRLIFLSNLHCRYLKTRGMVAYA